MDREKIIKGWECHMEADTLGCADCPYRQGWKTCNFADTLFNDVYALLKEQEAVKWINVKDRLPEKDGLYLVVYTFFDCRGMGVVRFSHNLHEIDEYIFGTESRPGWYEPDDEVGYFERTTVTHWAKLPEFPKECR